MRLALLLLVPFLMGATLQEPCFFEDQVTPLDDLGVCVVTATETRTGVQATLPIAASSPSGCTNITFDETAMIPGATGPVVLTAICSDLGGDPSVVSNALPYFFPDGVPPGPPSLSP